MLNSDDQLGLKELEIAWRQAAKWGQNVYVFYDALAAEEFRGRYTQELLVINSELASQTYEFSPFYSFTVTKPSGDIREMAQPQIRDDIVAQALMNVLGPTLRPKIPAESYAYQDYYHTEEHVRASDDIFLHWGRCYSEYSAAVEDGITLHKDAVVVRTDISNFYPNIHQKLLIQKLEDAIPNKEGISRLIRGLIEFRVMRPDGSIAAGQGLAIALAYSHLFSNFYLNELDQKWIARSLTYARYVDDIVAVFSNESEAQSFISEFDEDLGNLGLKRNVDKTKLSESGSQESIIKEITVKKYRLSLLSLQGGDDEESELAETTFKELFNMTLLDVEDVEQITNLAPHLTTILRRYGESEFRQQLVNISYECLKLGSTDPVGIYSALVLITFEDDYFVDDRFRSLLAQESTNIQITFLRLLIEQSGIQTPAETLLELTHSPHLLVRILAFEALRIREVKLSGIEIDEIIEYQLEHYKETDSLISALAYLASSATTKSINQRLPLLDNLSSLNIPSASKAVVEFLSIESDRDLINLLFTKLLRQE